VKASSSRRSFAKVVQATISSPADSCGLKKPILGLLDLFPMAACFEWENGGENLRLAVDCSEMEKRANAGSKESSGPMKKMKGTLVNRSQNKILGFAWRKLCNRIKAKVGRVVGYGLDHLPTVGF
jgi:hypothetical protein